MASLLNMLNNFPGAAGQPPLSNNSSTNVTQSADFKSVVGKLLNGGEGDEPNLTELPLNADGGAELPLLDAVGNALPAQLPAATLDFDASVQLDDIELAAAVGSTNGGGLVTMQTGITTTVDTNALTQPVVADALELTALSGIDTAMNSAAALPTPLGGVSEQVTAEHTTALQSDLTTALAASNSELAVGTSEVSTDAQQPLSNNVAALAMLLTQAQAQTSGATEAPADATPAMATLAADGKPQFVASEAGAAITAPANPSAANAATGTNTTPTAQVAPQNVAQTNPQSADMGAAALVTKDPQQFALEQAPGDAGGSDNDAPAEGVRQTLMPPGPALRAAPPAAASLQPTDSSFANVANMLNQGQSMNSLNDRLQLMLSNGQNSAEIRLDPPELGSLQVKVTTRNEQTQVIFVAPNNAVRDALEQQLPRLREALENAGLQLQDANVFAQTDDKPNAQPQSYTDVEAADNIIESETEDNSSDGRGRRLSTQLVDAYI